MRITLLIFFLAFASTLFSQKSIIFNNPSFEDEPQHGKAPVGWMNCGTVGESPPDVQPNDQFKVIKEAFDGNTYLGMVVRDNETWEAVGQRLKQPLVADSTYAFGIYIARSQYYVSLSRATGEEVNYASGCVLRIWGGNEEYCDRSELLYETKRINNSRWQLNNIVFTPKMNHKYITLEIYYVTPIVYAYNGNIILDNIVSDISKLNIDLEKAKTNNQALSTTDLLRRQIKNTALSFFDLEDFPELENDLIGVKNMMDFEGYVNNYNVKEYFKQKSIEELEILLKNLKKFEINNTAIVLENLLPTIPAVLNQEPGTENQITTDFNENCEDLKDNLVDDEFEEKVDAYIINNKKELIRFYKY